MAQIGFIAMLINNLIQISLLMSSLHFGESLEDSNNEIKSLILEDGDFPSNEPRMIFPLPAQCTEFISFQAP